MNTHVHISHRVPFHSTLRSSNLNALSPPSIVRSFLFSNLSTVSQWNYTLREAVNQFKYQKAIVLFTQMLQKGMQPNRLTFPIIAKACGKVGSIRYSEIVHGCVVKSEFSADVYVQTAMMDAYVKCGCVSVARQVFDKMPERDIASWNALLLGLAQLGVGDQVLLLFKQMRVEGIRPDSVTVIGVSQSVKGREGVRVLKAVHCFGVRIGVDIDVSVSNTWVSSYSKVRDLDSAEKVFHGINPVFVTVVSWNSMIAGYAYFHKYLKAVSFYKSMLYDGFKPDSSTILNLLSSINQHEALFHGGLIHCHGIKTGCDSDVTILNTLISMYSKCDNVNTARRIFDNMMNKTCVSWTAMIGGYAEKGDLDEALTLFDSMEATGVKPDLVTILNLISGCGETGALEIGKWVENYAVLNGFSNNLMVSNALIDMYAKCGSLKEACEIFYNMRERTVVSWTSMISGCALNGEFKQSLTHFRRMLELRIKPNHITFLAVLQACNHGGLIEKGREIFDLMTKVYGINPELDHYSSMADLLARGGKINEAFDLIKTMPVEPDAGVWASLLSACKVHKNVEIGELAAHRLFEMDPQAAAPYVEMANIYASVGRWDGVMDVRRLMKTTRVKKFPGESVVQVNGKSFKFRVEDRCHPKGEVIYEVLDCLALQLKDESDLSNLEDCLSYEQCVPKHHNALYPTHCG
ncbi:putative tetratricopeptide-like helical domain superfamily [Helianthus annuus]|nr:putative tetratricopeptide-like helical domain superfamily [Helianthus annuus]